MYDTIIIGAGMSGLAAGIRLAHFDQRVCILERHTTIGGMNSFYRQRGRYFDVGLHALTNFAPQGVRGPLMKILRQLRLAWEELSLAPQLGSSIVFPGAALRFSNDFALLESEIHEHFPRQKDGFARLMAALLDYDDIGSIHTGRSAREVVGQYLDDPLLVEMLFCPLLFYGGAREHDMDFGEFSILFRSIFLEGLARPLAGIRLILRKLVDKFRLLGGELRLRCGVSRIAVKDGAVEKVILEDGSELQGRRILSSAGWPETLRLCDGLDAADELSAGRLSFIESISVLNASPRELGHHSTMVFFNDSNEFHYAKPHGLVDLRSGVICSPNNFAYGQPLSEGMVRVTALANFDGWAALNPQAYREAKRQWYERMVGVAVRFVPDFRKAVIDSDVFTPLTIRRFTGRENGAVYGAAKKRYDGTTPLRNLFICGTDQGLVGIVGSILSGISIANRYLLKG